MKIDYNPEGYWSVDSVKSRYDYLRSYLGGVEGFELIPRTHTNQGGFTWTYNIMATVVDGIQLDDKACIELSVEYIEANIMGTTTGYIRERMARSLRHVELTSEQKQRLGNTFIKQLEHQSIHKEYKEYIRLFKIIGIDKYRNMITKYLSSKKDYIQRAARKLLADY